MIYFEADDGRICLVFDYLGRALVGSTDIPAADPDAVRCEDPEIDYFLASLRALLPDAGTAEINKHVQDLLESSRQATSKLKSRLMALEGTAGDLGKAVQATETKLRGELDQRLGQERRTLLARLEELLDANQALAARVAELEKPRGLRALWHWMFGKKKKGQPEEAEAEAETA